MKIYLDIDGVLIPERSWQTLIPLEDGFSMFNSKSVKALNEIIEYNNADIVLISFHKSTYTIEKWREILTTRKIIVNGLDKLPDNPLFLNRHDELMKYFNKNEIDDDFIIIDDDKSLNKLEPYYKDKLIQPSSVVGLTDRLISITQKIWKKNLD